MKYDLTSTGFRAGVLLSTVLIAAPISFAQSANEDEARQETIVVTGTPIRDSQAAAIDAKKNADNVVDILSADTIGRFPDQNLADSLGRIPGLGIERDQGQARFINFRGAPFDYTKIAFDGIDVLGAEDGRTPRFDAFPSVVTQKIEVNKAITADMPGEATVGYIDIQTFKPFDREGLSFAGEAGFGKQELGDVDINKYNGRLSYSNDQFGVVVFGSHNLRGRITDNREYDYTTDLSAVTELDFRSYRGEREDNAYGGRVEFRPSDNHTVFFSSLYSEFIDREERNQFVFNFEDTPIQIGQTAFVDSVEVTRLLEDGLYENSTFTNTLGYDGQLKDWNVEARLNYTETENTAFLPIPYSIPIAAFGLGVVGANISVEDILNPVVIPTVFGDPNTRQDLNALNFFNGELIFAQDEETEAVKAKLDLDRDVDFGGHATNLKFGFQYDTREAVGNSALDVDFGAGGGWPSSVNIADFATTTAWSSDFINSINATDYDNVGLRAAWEAAVGGLNVAYDPADATIIEEDVYAAYAMAKTDYDWGNLVYGLRFEQTDFSTSGTLVNEEGTNTAVAESNKYFNILPSMHINFDVRDDIKLRVSASSGFARPNYSEIRASRSVNPTSLEVNGGNPNLDPEESFGVDVSAEWYFAPASLFSVGTYVRSINNVIYPSSTIVDGSIYAPGLIAAGTDTTFNSFSNGDDGELTGIELNFIGSAADWLPEPFDGFGVTGNLTLNDSEFVANNGSKFSLPGTSSTIYNGSVFYEKFGVSARVNYQFRSAWLSTTENDSLNEFWDDTERVDASLRYTFPQEIFGTNVTLALNGNNLTDERDLRYVGSSATPNQYEGFGRRWVASIRIDY